MKAEVDWIILSARGLEGEGGNKGKRGRSWREGNVQLHPHLLLTLLFYSC